MAEVAPQVVPRPPGARPGDPAPWSGLAPKDRRGITLVRVRDALASPVGGAAVDEGRPQAAVLVALFEEQGEARVVLTRRSSTLRSHRGEVSFPGGRVDPGEAVVAAAVREASEEVALDPGDVEVIGELSQLTTISSQALITPVVGLLPHRPALRANPAEVERVFDVSLAQLAADNVHHQERWVRGEWEIGVEFFELPGDIVWGATGRVLKELLGLVLGVGGRTGPPTAPPSGRPPR